MSEIVSIESKENEIIVISTRNVDNNRNGNGGQSRNTRFPTILYVCSSGRRVVPGKSALATIYLSGSPIIELSLLSFHSIQPTRRDILDTFERSTTYRVQFIIRETLSRPDDFTPTSKLPCFPPRTFLL